MDQVAGKMDVEREQWYSKAHLKMPPIARTLRRIGKDLLRNIKSNIK
jgi:hypothetical protein